MTPEAYAFLGGKQVPLEDAKVGVMTHALHYGTAVFEGIRGNWNEAHGKMYVFRLREHYERLLRGCRMLRIDLPYNADELCKITTELIERNGYRQDIYIRPLAFKGQEAVANLKLHELDDEFTVVVLPFGNYIENDRPLRCQTSSGRFDDANRREDHRSLHDQHSCEDRSCDRRLRRGDSVELGRNGFGGKR